MSTAKTKDIIEVPSNQTELRATLGVLRDQARPANERRVALQAIQAASFGTIEFESVRADYTAVLREVARDPDDELRRRSLGILAREHDGVAQKALLDGLRDSKKALVPPEKALQLLSYDVHAGAQALSRDLLESSASTEEKRQAIRILAGDPDSVPLFLKLVSDKGQPSDIRRAAGAALNSLDPDKFQQWARRAIVDPGESPEILTASLTALQFGRSEDIAGDKGLLKRLKQLRGKGSPKVKKLAQRCSQKHGLD